MENKEIELANREELKINKESQSSDDGYYEEGEYE